MYHFSVKEKQLTLLQNGDKPYQQWKISHYIVWVPYSETT
ncbi:hypothetical protein HMPREF9971_0344 [Streptococcus parasanguinis F0449]|uniref:Uncharacterized protein n=1 Tax=Streptococcus parasanguinis F0449 TaxID=1095733 RepID=I2NMK7_STRPA|nr:hypothetical protein HMPREF9971_0344 [Streptococcus parasanguinis F0449]